ncbi:uncharacterized protein B0H18DRAFT_583851 [Fomitopsis serialis]|uniref:uncharacterized protein n=1 Tax=Fomitopsis serialis TaxID=139415 RepID=UPI002007826E|nr:uncharacterized protein B0H18DRAFT_583851 [Neoantrodia serialis]KAH9907679.1 hypothetical protein B0H18DRAFT_583851 [Neoantrodia serialis]
MHPISPPVCLLSRCLVCCLAPSRARQNYCDLSPRTSSVSSTHWPLVSSSRFANARSRVMLSTVPAAATCAPSPPCRRQTSERCLCLWTVPPSRLSVSHASRLTFTVPDISLFCVLSCLAVHPPSLRPLVSYVLRLIGL